MRNEHFANTYSSEPRYNTKAVVRETGVPADTFRAWERRYGVPIPHRTATGQRLYSERDIAIIRWLRDRTAEGLTISQAVRLLEGAQEAAVSDDQPAAWTRLEQQLVDALLRLDTTAAEDVLAQAFAHYSLDDVCLKLIEPALVAIGEGWHNGTVSVGQEHFATQLLRRRLQSLFSVYDVAEGRATIVAGCAPGEQHDIGLLILALLLVRRGYRVVYLGPDVPLHGLLPVMEQVETDMICLSASTPETASAIDAIAAAVRELARPPVVVAGGRGVGEGTGAGELYVGLDTNTLTAIDQIGTLLAQRRAGV